MTKYLRNFESTSVGAGLQLIGVNLSKNADPTGVLPLLLFPSPWQAIHYPDLS